MDNINWQSPTIKKICGRDSKMVSIHSSTASDDVKNVQSSPDLNDNTNSLTSSQPADGANNNQSSLQPIDKMQYEASEDKSSFNPPEDYKQQQMPENFLGIDPSNSFVNLTIPPFPEAGTRQSQAQSINETWFKSNIRIQEHYQKKLIDLNFKYNDKMMEQFFSKNNASGSSDGTQPVSIPQKIDFRAYGRRFQQIFSIVKIRERNRAHGVIYMIRSADYNRHIPIDEGTLRQEFDYYSHDYASTSNDRDYAFIDFRKNIPYLKDSGLTQLRDNQLMFRNGFYDLQENSFHPIHAEEMRNYYNEFSIEIDYPADDEKKEPIVFEKLLFDMFGDSKMIHLAYQYIGAILTPVATLKKIFVFQGKSGGGKTRLSTIIMQLMPEEDTEDLSTLSDISKANAKVPWIPRRLMYINEHGNKKISPQQIANLKSAADGRSHLGRNFKILINTNYVISTGDFGAVEPGIYNRFTVLPFPKVMENKEDVAAFEDVYFEQEKASIIRKALEAFSEVLNNNNQFDCPYLLNECVEAEDVKSNCLSEQELHSLEKVKTESISTVKPKLSTVLDKLFIITGEINQNMNAMVVRNSINKILPGTIKDNAHAGRVLSKQFGDKLQSDYLRLEGKQEMCYNLEFRSSSKTYDE